METKICKRCNENKNIENFKITQYKTKLKSGEIKISNCFKLLCIKCDIINKKEKRKIYYDNNKDEIYKKRLETPEKRKKFFETRKKYRKRTKNNRKLYDLNNKEKIKEQKKIYWKNNFIKHLLDQYKNTDKNKNREFNLNEECVLNKLKEQNSKCYHCGINLNTIYNENKLSNLSVDRLDLKLGHINNNIVISCQFCNYGRNASNVDYFKDFINSIKTNKIKNYNFDIDLKIFTQLRWRCYYTDNKKKIVDTITTEHIKELYEKQNGKCAITGLPMMNVKQYMFPYKMSVDRIDNLKGHTKDNVQLVCLAINYGKNRYTNEDVLAHIDKIKNTHNN